MYWSMNACLISLFIMFWCTYKPVCKSLCFNTLCLKSLGFESFYARYFPRSWSTALAAPLWSFVYFFLYRSHWNNSRYGSSVLTHFKYIEMSKIFPMLIKTLMFSRLLYTQSKVDIPTSRVYVNSSMLNMKKILQVLNLPR